MVDDIAIVKSMYTDQFNHAPAELFLYTGSSRNGGAAMGSWITYGLGSENQDLPGFVVLISGGTDPTGGKALWSTGFLPSVYQGVQCRTVGDPILYVSDPKGMDRADRRRTLDALRQLNDYELAEFGDPETLTRISQYELAFRMQMAVPDVMDIRQEPERDSSKSTARSPGQRRSPTTAFWPAGWSSAGCVMSSSSTGAGIATAPVPATISSSTCRKNAGKSTGRSRPFWSTSSGAGCWTTRW